MELLSAEERKHGPSNIPLVKQDTEWSDHGRAYLSRAFQEESKGLGANVQMGRP